MPVRCAIFDLDQTIAGTARLLYDSWNAAMQALGRPAATDAEVTAHFGPPEWVALKSVAGDSYPAAIDAYLRHYQANLGQVKVYAGVPELLESLGARGVFRAMLTGKGRATTEITLAHLGLRGHFDTVVTGDEIARPKPHPEGLHLILAHAGCPAGEAVMIGDMPSDIRAAHAAGMRGAAALWDCEWRDALMATRPDLALESVAALHEWLLTA